MWMDVLIDLLLAVIAAGALRVVLLLGGGNARRIIKRELQRRNAPLVAPRR
jgi:hypothetical protein